MRRSHHHLEDLGRGVLAWALPRALALAILAFAIVANIAFFVDWIGA